MRPGTLFVLAAVLALTIGAWFFGERLLAEQHRQALAADVESRLNALRDRLGTNLRANVQAVQGLISLIHLHPDLDQPQYERAALPILAAGGQLRNVAVAPGLVIRLVVPMQGNEKAVGLDYRSVPAQLATVEWARLSRNVVLAGPLPLVQGGVGLIARIPVFMLDAHGQEEFWGVVSAVIDVDRLYADSGLVDPDLPIEVAIRGRNASGSAGEVFYGRPDLFAEGPVSGEIDFPIGSWHIAALPRGGWPRQPPGIWAFRATLVAAAAVLLALLLALERSMWSVRQALARSRESERRTQQVADNLPALVARLDAQHRYTFANETHLAWLGVRPQDMLGRRVDEVLGADRYERLRPHIEQALASGERLSFDEIDSTRHLNATYVPEVDDDGLVSGVFSLTTDVTELKEVERQLSLQANHDHLTGLLNRRSFEDAFALALARVRRLDAGLGLMFIDVDHFKSINDNLGHAAGDAVLREVGARLRSAVREVDHVARLGGDEFVVLLDNLSGRAAAEIVANKVAAALRAPIALPEGGRVEVTVSIGVALHGGQLAVDAASLMAAADAALYAAKRDGRDRFDIVRCQG